MTAILIEDVTKRWGTHTALKVVNFAVQRGGFTVLLGPSGCGKSTTLRLIAGLEQADSGRILIEGRDVTRLPPSRREVSMVFQSYALFPHLSVAENIVFGLRVRKVNSRDRHRSLHETANMLGLSSLLDRKPSQISGGQQQRVALARAIVARKPICLMDEPLSNLDAQLRAEMRREIRRLQRKLEITMVYVTHDQTEAMTMADQVVLLRDGQIEQDASPDELYVQPESVFAARFVGAPPMNVIKLDSVGSLDTIRQFRDVKEGCLLGVRPEDVRFDGCNGIPARVDSVEFLGADSLLSCTCGSTTILSRVPGRTVITSGTEVTLSWSPESQHLFDAETGRRIRC